MYLPLSWSHLMSTSNAPATEYVQVTPGELQNDLFVSNSAAPETSPVTLQLGCPQSLTSMSWSVGLRMRLRKSISTGAVPTRPAGPPASTTNESRMSWWKFGGFGATSTRTPADFLMLGRWESCMFPFFRGPSS